ncbi:B12-binding domain-containing radical SAM protein [Arabiibacter massiliensis]|uniref:B12-binding domain-containing radical SAM protein n=1 Tax=Arabiibacter massiliensis TaxID=1870985 RepID=UPI0009BC15DF|nr:radical SAM protein [Arabiibacter massiliensis]
MADTISEGALDALFVVPSFDERDDADFSGPIILMGRAREAGLACELAGFARFDPSRGGLAAIEQGFAAFLHERCPRIVAFYCRCDTAHIMVRLAQAVKREAPAAFTVLGGPQADLTAVEALEAFPWVDFVCCGEGEAVVGPFFASLAAGSADLSTPGLVYRAGGSVRANPRPELLSMEYRLGNYLRELDPELLRKRDRAMIDAGRGCPFSCTFCSTKTFWKRTFRMRSIDDMLDQVERLQREHGVGRFEFEHDLFTASRKRVLAFCDAVEARGLKFGWSCSSRVDTLDDELIERMRRAGAVAVYLGVETGSPRMQRLVNKNLDVGSVVPVARSLREAGMEVTASFVYGFPDEAEEDLALTLRLALDLEDAGLRRVQLHRLGFLNGTELFERWGGELVYDPDRSEMVSQTGIRELEGMVRTHLGMFPHFCSLPGTVADAYPHALDFLRAYKRAPRAMGLAVRALGEGAAGALAACRAFHVGCADVLGEIEGTATSSFDTEEWLPFDLRLIEAFMAHLGAIGTVSAEERAALADFASYETAVLRMVRDPSQPERTVDYRFDWRAIKQGEPLGRIACGRATLSLVRDGRLVRTKVVDLHEDEVA